MSMLVCVSRWIPASGQAGSLVPDAQLIYNQGHDPGPVVTSMSYEFATEGGQGVKVMTARVCLRCRQVYVPEGQRLPDA